MDERSGRARRPATAESDRTCSPRTTDSLAAMCAAHGPAVSACRFSPGTIFGDWRLTAFIGRGGNGEVYCAEHVTLGTPAAVKVLVRDETRAKERFAREAKLLAELKSTSFPKFFAYGEAKSCPYLAMELLEPGELPTGERAIARFLLAVCDAVAELHAQGFLHRDIKPGNILWRRAGGSAPYQAETGAPPATAGSGRAGSLLPVAVPVLADLGLAKTISTSAAGHPPSDVTVGGVGTPGYGAPEQMERGEATVASDIHALGVLADRCFNGRPPRTWARIIERATSSIPARRYPSVASFARAIRHRHLLANMGIAVACVAMLFALGVALKNLGVPIGKIQQPTPPPAVQSPVKETSVEDLGHVDEGGSAKKGMASPEQPEPVLSAVAVLDGREAKDVLWFLDGNQVEMPYRFTKTERRGNRLPYKWLRAVVRRDGRVYSAKECWMVPNWKGERHLSLTLREDPATGTPIRLWSPGGVPFDFVWHPRGEGTAGFAGYGYWMSVHGLTGRQLGAIVQEGLLYTPFSATKRYDFSSDSPVQLEPPDATGIPEFSFQGTGMVMGPMSDMRMEDSVRRNGKSATDMYLTAISGFANETNTVLHCAALDLLRSDRPDEVIQGEKMLLGFLKSNDREFAATAREICLARGLVPLESCGANPELRFREAAVRNGNARTLERLATTDPNSDIRTEAYERLQNPSQMVSARYVSRIAADFSDDIGKPIKIIQTMTDHAALEYVIKNAILDYFQDLAKERLNSIK